MELIAKDAGKDRVYVEEGQDVAELNTQDGVFAQ